MREKAPDGIRSACGYPLYVMLVFKDTGYRHPQRVLHVRRDCVDSTSRRSLLRAKKPRAFTLLPPIFLFFRLRQVYLEGAHVQPRPDRTTAPAFELALT